MYCCFLHLIRDLALNAEVLKAFAPTLKTSSYLYQQYLLTTQGFFFASDFFQLPKERTADITYITISSFYEDFS